MLAETRTRPCHDFAAIEASCITSNPDAAPLREILERNVLHRSEPQSAGQPGVVNDAAVADIDAVMAVESSPGNEVRRERWFLARAKRPMG